MGEAIEHDVVDTTAVEVTTPRRRRIAIYLRQRGEQGVRNRLVAWANAPESAWTWLRTEFSFGPGAWGELGTEIMEPRPGQPGDSIDISHAIEDQIARNSHHILDLHSAIRTESQTLASVYRDNMNSEIRASEQRINEQRKREQEEFALSNERIDAQRRREEDAIASSEKRIDDAYERMRKTLEAVDSVLPLLQGAIASAARPGTAQAMAESLVELLRDPHSPIGQLLVAKARTLGGISHAKGG